MKDIFGVVLIFIFGIVFSLFLSHRVDEVNRQDNLVQNYSYNCEICNN